ncbi:MAG TPA: fibronectin type III domain-containing protein [Phycisphaerae bacterium]|nr:fibronectin type III domain-containing protein [Phycisphaerae bacterium]
MTIIHERGAQRVNDVLRQLLKITGLTKFLGGLLVFAAINVSVQANVIGPNSTANVTLAWNQITNPIVAGYNIYYGGISGVYTNKTSVGLVTNLTISNLVVGTTYYFAATTYSAAGAESAFSSEVAYTVPTPPPGVQLLITPARQFILTVTGPAGHTYDIQATQDFKAWTVIGTVTVGASGSLNFTDTNAASFSSRCYRTHDTAP